MGYNNDETHERLSKYGLALIILSVGYYELKMRMNGISHACLN